MLKRPHQNYMNSVERGAYHTRGMSFATCLCLVVHFARGDVVPKEAAHESDAQHKPAQEWPARGAIEFKDVTMAYRPGLPNVLHGISLQINAGEKIGVVGRTGAGKSSLTLCLLRIVEYSGQIVIDEYVCRRHAFSSVYLKRVAVWTLARSVGFSYKIVCLVPTFVQD